MTKAFDDKVGFMAKCEECSAWYPSQPGWTKQKLVPLFHKFECQWHFMVPEEVWEEAEAKWVSDYASDLEDELGRHFGHSDLAMYIFEGNLLYEVSADGTRRIVSSYSNYPDKVKELANGPSGSVKPDTPAPGSQEWKDERAKFVKETQERIDEEIKRQAAEREKKAKEAKAFSFHNRPWATVDRKKWPKLWMFYVKMAFLPTAIKDIKYTNGSSSYSHYNNYNSNGPYSNSGMTGHHGRYVNGRWEWE